MVRTQIQLTEAQHQRLKLEARRQDVPMAEIIRQLLDRWMTESATEVKFLAALSVVGKYSDTAHDVSTCHDEYLREAWGT